MAKQQISTTQRISTTDVHLIECDDGNISVKFDIVSPKNYRELLGQPADIMLRRVVKDISGLTLFVNEQPVEESAVLDAVCDSATHANWLAVEYMDFMEKKAQMLLLQKQRDAGPISTTNPNSAS